MNISLDNITFYSQPPPAKPPSCTFPVSCWKPYETPLASRALSRVLPPRAPSPRTTITLASDARPDVSPRFRAPAREGHDLRAVCNEFDIELDRIVTAQNGQVTREADLTLHRDSGLPNGNDTDGPQDQRTSSVPGPVFDPTENLELHRDSTPLLGTCYETNEDSTSPEVSFPYTRASPSPSPDILESVRHLQAGPVAGVIMGHESAVDDTKAGPDSSGDRAEGRGDGMTTVQSVQSSSPSVKEADLWNDERGRLTEENQATALSRFGPRIRPLEQSKCPLTHTRSLRAQPSRDAAWSERLPAVSVLIPARRTDDLVSSTKTNPPTGARCYSRRGGGDSSNLNHDRATPALTEEDSSFSGGSSSKTRGRPRRRPKRAMENTSASTNEQSPNPSVGGLDVTPGKTQEIFGRGILRIQAHGPRHVYFMSFLPEEPHQPSMPSTFEDQEEHSHSRDSGVSGHCENQIGNQHSEQPFRKGSRAGKSTGRAQALSKDDRLLIELKEERSLPWKRIAEYFPGRSVGSLQVRYCTRLKVSKAGNSGRSGRNSNVTSGSSYRGTSCEAVQAADGRRKNTEGVARQRYGPPRRRQIVDRYSPV
ncbi:hypothetical protein PENSUB_570 [Penicillium subrubescens]|uniref:Myb-like domain-containing protein n=1 Tax=Penicillium subrubescens TaxID=1316194 RepID=A0A1Q5UMM0_9EURO|nr:hypothetical protein PENSUB_570 [Penicillium subrubescens]